MTAWPIPWLLQQAIAIDVEKDVLTIRGEKQVCSETRDKQYYRVERHYGNFQCSLSLPDDAVVDEVEASLKNGVLKLNIPRREGSSREVKSIEIH